MYEKSKHTFGSLRLLFQTLFHHYCTYRLAHWTRTARINPVNAAILTSMFDCTVVD